MPAKLFVKSVVLFVIVGFVMATDNYINYGDEIQEKSPTENIRELYKLLMQRNVLDNVGFDDVPLEHLMIRKSQRSPSLRLRFGRSDPHLSIGLLQRPLNTVASRFDDN